MIGFCLSVIMVGTLVGLFFASMCVRVGEPVERTERRQTRAELTTQVLLDRAREAYLAGEVEVDEFEARVADALRGNVGFCGPYSDSKPGQAMKDATVTVAYHEELKATDGWLSKLQREKRWNYSAADALEERKARTLEDAIREGKAVGPREHAPRVLVEADMDRKIAETRSSADVVAQLHRMGLLK